MVQKALPIAILLATSPGLAQPSPSLPHVARLAYTAPTACPAEQVLRDLVAGQTSFKVFAPEARAQLTVTISRRRQRYEATAELRDQSGAVLWTRPFPAAPSCAGLVEEVAVYVSEKLEPHADDQPRAPARPPASSAVEISQTPTQVHEYSAPMDPYLITIGLGAAVGFGIAPRVAVGLSADVGIHRKLDTSPLEGLSLSLGVRWDPPAAGHVPGAPMDARVSTSRLLGTVVPCGHWWKLFGCAVGELGQLQGGADNTYPLSAMGTAFYAAAGARAGIEVPFAPHIGFRGFGEILGTLTPLTVRVNERPAWTTPPASGGFGAGIYVFF
jgi:hypothetical protein